MTLNRLVPSSHLFILKSTVFFLSLQKIRMSFTVYNVK